MQLTEDKKELRRRVKQSYKSLTQEERRGLSELAASKMLLRLSEVPSGTKIGVFLSMWDELDTSFIISSLMAEGHLKVLIPRVEGEEMQFYPYDPVRIDIISEYGIMEPNNPEADADVPEVMVVPGIAFDTDGGRVGRGKGFYDKYFSRYSRYIKAKIAFVASFQIFPHVPMDSHDIRMDEIITDKEHFMVE
ncbi:5-formyltetrahydrofolate cyclo-ligase [Porphyromonas sp.]|uniref:5-formyltetrahydrofolate cyclo-ligase n=1 Tax=Porphyromonas sp. TaxID=1924944 RepID=UPI0026DCBF96|nr:5-formyltetrahydrofolate cyclo-ligase [Porphyromonas sp.]MDO4695550.1 5-formyltetrahydrofolate cyclo-ligase [Porphyromonas sp.]MDO4771357.1 5-formyltetrahydrofolate cyclo-ligase [Porphyromonas sp.]